MTAPCERAAPPKECPGLRRSDLITGVTLLVLSLLAYLPAYNAGYVWDDDDYVLNNATLRAPQGLVKIWADPLSTPQYYPLVHTSFWVEYRLWGLRPQGYHAVNVLLHALAALLLWRVLLKVDLPPPAAALAAILWSVHPVQVESVAWITERKNTLSALFYLLTFWSLLRWERPGRRPVGWCLLALAFFGCALTSKTVTATLPAAWLLVHWWRSGRLDLRRDVLPMLPFLIAGACMARVTAGLEVTHVGAAGPEWAFTPADRILIAGRAVAFYLGKLALPVNLSFIYPRWEVDPRVAWQWAFPTLALGVLALLFAMRKRWGRGPFVACAFFVGTLLPALGFFNIFPQRYSFVADHFQHLASIGPLALAAVALARAPIVARALVVTVLCALTFAQCRVYLDKPTLWADAAAKNPTGWLPQLQLGFLEAEASKAATGAFERERHENAAFEHMLRAQALGPGVATPNWNLGVAHEHRGDHVAARAAFEQALRCDPDFALAYNSLGKLDLAAGSLQAARDNFERAVEKQPGFPEAHENLAEALWKLGDLEGAAKEYAAAASVAPDNAPFRLALARAVFRLALATPEPASQQRQLQDAAGQYLYYLRMNPRDAQATLEMSQVLRRMGRPEADEYLRQARRLDPNIGG